MFIFHFKFSAILVKSLKLNNIHHHFGPFFLFFGFADEAEVGFGFGLSDESVDCWLAAPGFWGDAWYERLSLRVIKFW